MEEASYLAKICKQVILVHRRDTLRASKIMQRRVLENPKVRPIWNTEVEEVLGNDRQMTGAILKNVKTGERNELKADGLFVAIGHTPNTELVKDHLEMQANGYVKTVPGSTRTNIPGVFACGDVQDHYYRQAVTAAGTGCMAAIDAERWMLEHG
jgi:thioredoxin reductase (NADPH)